MKTSPYIKKFNIETPVAQGKVGIIDFVINLQNSSQKSFSVVIDNNSHLKMHVIIAFYDESYDVVKKVEVLADANAISKSVPIFDIDLDLVCQVKLESKKTIITQHSQDGLAMILDKFNLNPSIQEHVNAKFIHDTKKHKLFKVFEKKGYANLDGMKIKDFNIDFIAVANNVNMSLIHILKIKDANMRQLNQKLDNLKSDTKQGSNRLRKSSSNLSQSNISQDKNTLNKNTLDKNTLKDDISNNIFNSDIFNFEIDYVYEQMKVAIEFVQGVVDDALEEKNVVDVFGYIVFDINESINVTNSSALLKRRQMIDSERKLNGHKFDKVAEDKMLEDNVFVVKISKNAKPNLPYINNVIIDYKDKDMYGSFKDFARSVRDYIDRLSIK